MKIKNKFTKIKNQKIIIITKKKTKKKERKEKRRRGKNKKKKRRRGKNKEKERIRKKKEEEERIKQEKERKKRERKYNTTEEFIKLEEERYKKEEEKILSDNKSKIYTYNKYINEIEKKELKEKEEQDKDEKSWKSYKKLGVKFRTTKEIKDFAKDIMLVLEDQMIYDIQPKLTPQYNSGKISKKTLDNSMKYLNSLRFAAGLSYDIGLTDEYLKLAQDASLLCQVNNLLQHSDQPKPKNMDQKLFESGDRGCNSIFGWVSDKDSGNFDRMGHR